VPDVCLAIEISNPSAEAGTGVAAGVLSRGSVQPLGSEPLAPDRKHDDDLLPAIDRLFTRIERVPKHIARVGVSIGPGGFTSLRMACAAAKMLCEVTGAECVGVPSAEVVARRGATDSPFAVALSSKGQTAFVTCFDAPDRARAPGALAGAEDLEGLGMKLLIADRFLPQSMRDRAASLGVEIRPPVFDPIACLECAAAATPIDPLELLPLYPRPPEAVVKWRQLHPKP